MVTEDALLDNTCLTHRLVVTGLELILTWWRGPHFRRNLCGRGRAPGNQYRLVLPLGLSRLLERVEADDAVSFTLHACSIQFLFTVRASHLARPATNTALLVVQGGVVVSLEHGRGCHRALCHARSICAMIAQHRRRGMP